MNRPKVSVYIAISIDGFIAREDGSLDWLEKSGSPDEEYGLKGLLESIDCVILGRKTYEVVEPIQQWPYKGKRVIVLSQHLKRVRGHAELFTGDVTKLLSQLYGEGVKHLWVDGGATIAQFIALHMVDSITLTIIPIILGSGISLFKGKHQELTCKLVSAHSFPSGLAQLRYESIPP